MTGERGFVFARRLMVLWIILAYALAGSGAAALMWLAAHQAVGSGFVGGAVGVAAATYMTGVWARFEYRALLAAIEEAVKEAIP